MKKKRRITSISRLGLFVLFATSLAGCDLFPTIESTANRTHISQEEKDQALANKGNWCSNRIDSATPTLTMTPASEITVSITNKIYPSSVKKGESFNICGLISTSIGTIDKVSGSFIAKDGTVVIKTSDNPKSSMYELKRSTVDLDLAFGDLELGEYICVIKAKGSNFAETEVMRFNFTISTKTVTSTTLDTTTTPTTVPPIEPTTKPTTKPTNKTENTLTKPPVKPLTDAEREIADKVVNAVYPKNSKIVVDYKKANNSGYETYKITSKYDEKSVSTIQEYEDDATRLEAADSYITAVGSTIKKFVYIDGCGWRRETVNKSHLTPAGNKTAVAINLGEYIDNTTGGEWSVKATSSEYIISCTGLKNKSNGNVSKDVTIITDKNYEIKSVNIKIQDISSVFKGERGYNTDITIEVSDKSKTKVSVPTEVTSDVFDFEQYVVNVMIQTHKDENITVNRDASGKVSYFSYYSSEKERKITTTFNEAVRTYGLEKYK